LPCLLQIPFTVSKAGPFSVKAGEAFDYNLIVSFFGAATGVVVTDDLPPQLTAQSKLASWKAVTVNGQNPSGGEAQLAACAVLQ
jgi:hypothetical protein